MENEAADSSDEYVETVVEFYDDGEEDAEEKLGREKLQNFESSQEEESRKNTPIRQKQEENIPTRQREEHDEEAEEEYDEQEKLEKRTIEIVDQFLNTACLECGLTTDWLVDRMIPENVDKGFLSTFNHMRQAFARLVKDDEQIQNYVFEWAADKERSTAFASFQRQARNLTELIMDAKRRHPSKLREWERRGVDIREYKGRDTIMIHKNTPVFELMLTANSIRLHPFDLMEFRKALADDLAILQQWSQGKDIDKHLVEEACEIIYETLKPREIESIEQEIQIYATCWGAPNRLAGHLLNLTDAGTDALFDIWTNICKVHGFQDLDISSPVDLEEVLFYHEFLGKDKKGNSVPNINMLPHVGCPFKMWQHLLLKLAAIRGHRVSHDNLDNKSLEFVFDLHKAANKEAIRLAGELDFVREIRKEISRALKRHPKFSKKIKSYKMDRLRIKKLILTDRGLTPQFCLNSFQDLMEFLLLEIHGVEIQEKDQLVSCIRNIVENP